MKVQIWGRSRNTNTGTFWSPDDAIDINLGIHRMGGSPRIGDHVYVDEDNGWDGVVEDLRWELSSELLEIFLLLPWREDRYKNVWMPTNETV